MRGRQGYRNGSYQRSLTTTWGTIPDLEIPRSRVGRTLAELLGDTVSASTVSTITRTLDHAVAACTPPSTLSIPPSPARPAESTCSATSPSACASETASAASPTPDGSIKPPPALPLNASSTPGCGPGSQSPPAVACVLRDWEALLAFYAVPQQDRRKVRTTNAIERAFREVRRRTRPMTCFTNDASCDRIIYAVMHYLNNQWQGRSLCRESTQHS